MSEQRINFGGYLKRARVSAHGTAFVTTGKALYVVDDSMDAHEYISAVEPLDKRENLAKTFWSAAGIIGAIALVGLVIQGIAGRDTPWIVGEFLPSIVGATIGVSILAIVNTAKRNGLRAAAADNPVPPPLVSITGADPEMLRLITPEVREQIQAAKAGRSRERIVEELLDA